MGRYTWFDEKSGKAVSINGVSAKEMNRLASDLKAKDAELTSLKAENEALKTLVKRIDETLRVPAAEYVPAIRDVFVSIDNAREALSKCDKCNGTGSVTESWGIVPDIESSVTCPKCNGTGEALSQSKTEVGG